MRAVRLVDLPIPCMPMASSRNPHFRLLGRVHFGDEPTLRRIPAREVDAGGLADDAATAVAADEVLARSGCRRSSATSTPRVVLHEAVHVAFAIDRHRRARRPSRRACARCGSATARARTGAGLGRRRCRAGYVRSPRPDALDPARGSVRRCRAGRAPRWCVRANRRRANRRVPGCAPLDDRDVDARQREFARQHQAGRTAARDQHRMAVLAAPVVSAAREPLIDNNALISSPRRLWLRRRF